MKTIFFLLIVVFSLQAGNQFPSNVDQVFSEAKKEKKPILIDFFGIWCPPCNELDETVFENPRFIEKAKAFKLLKVDADKIESWKIKDKYNVGGYPTVIFTNFNGEEVYRIVGYRSLNEFLRIMDLVLKSKGKQFEQACKSKAVEELWRCAIISSERDDKKMAEKAFKAVEKKVSHSSPRYAVARHFFVEQMKSDEEKRAGYERLLTEMPASPMAIYWATEYMGLFKEGAEQKPKREILEKVLAEFPKAKADPSKEELGLPYTDLLQMKADILTHLGKDEEAKATWKEAADVFEKQTLQLPKGVYARGFTIERVYCLEQAGEIDKALEIANVYRERYPEEFTFHFQTATILKRQKKFEEAIPIAEKAFQHSYGDNKIRAGTLLIQLYATQSNKEGAKKIFDAVQEDVKPEKDLKIRTHRYLTKLQEEMNKL